MDGYNTAKVEFLEDKKVPEDQVQGGWKFKFKLWFISLDLLQTIFWYLENPLF
jgi:hypothetical protein